MKKYLMIALTLIVSGAAFADDGVDCGSLNVVILNRSGHTCILNGAQVGAGRIVFGAASEEIPNGTITPNFRVQQSYILGARVRLSYICQNKSIVLTSQQNFCLLQSGNISGQIESSNNVFANFSTQPGSYWYKLPGQIFWTIY